MCGQCAMLATGAAAGTRVAIAHYLRFWLTPRRLRAITVALGCAALLGSTLSFGGTNAPSSAARPPATASASLGR